jgi:hypothetical protein
MSLARVVGSPTQAIPSRLQRADASFEPVPNTAAMITWMYIAILNNTVHLMQFSSLLELLLGNPIDRSRLSVADRHLTPSSENVGVKRLASHPLAGHSGRYHQLNLRSNVAPVDVRVPVYNIHGHVVAERFVQASVIEQTWGDFRSGTERNYRDVGYLVAFGGKADIGQRLPNKRDL